MEGFLSTNVNWTSVFAPSAPLLELVVRATAMYWFLFIVFRLFVRRDKGSLAMADIVLLVIVASASRNALAGNYFGITDGIVTIAVIVAWNVVADWAAFRSRRMEEWLEPPRRLLIEDGRIVPAALEREFMTERQLLSKLREHGVERVDDVRRAWLESSGSVTVIRNDA